MKFQKLFGKYFNKSHIAWINKIASPAKIHLILDFTIKSVNFSVNIEIELLGKKS